MKLSKKQILPLLALATAMFSGSAFADFTGDWNGTGVATHPDGSTTPCTMIHFNIAQDAKSLAVNVGEYACGSDTAQTKNVTFKIQGGDLTIFGTKVGTISANHVHLDIAKPGEKVRKVYEILTTATGVRLEHTIEDMSGNVQLLINGELSK